MRVQEVLTPNVERIIPDTVMREAAAKMKEHDLGALPVYEGDRLVGMVTDRDIVVRGLAEEKDPARCPVREVMSAGMFYCFDDQDITEAAKIMREKQVRRLVVLDRNHRLVGIISLGDIAAAGPTKVSGAALKGVSRSH